MYDNTCKFLVENFSQDFATWLLGLLPLAVLTKTTNPEATLRDIAKLIDKITDRKVKSDVAAATSIISGLALNKEIIQRLLRSEIMKESVIYQEILLEGLTEGKAQGLVKGKTEGKAEATNQIAINMLHSNISVEVIAQVTGLTLKQVQKLQKLSEKKTQIVKSLRRSPKN